VAGLGFDVVEQFEHLDPTNQTISIPLDSTACPILNFEI
jgi:hypothetical protein